MWMPGNVAGSIDFLKTGAPVAFAAVEDQELKREFTASNDSTIAAFENYKTYLEQELKPKADGDFALGSDLFVKRMAYNEMVDIPPGRLLDIAYAQLHKDRDALSEAARDVDPTAPIESVLKVIRAQHPTVDTLIPTARDELAGLRAFILNDHIATIPSDLLPKVEETPGFQRATTAAAMDPPGPLERRATQAFYYVTRRLHSCRPLLLGARHPGALAGETPRAFRRQGHYHRQMGEGRNSFP